jgi:hypothetical protein
MIWSGAFTSTRQKSFEALPHDMALTVWFGSNVTMIQPPLCARERVEEMAARLENSFDRREYRIGTNLQFDRNISLGLWIPGSRLRRALE